MNIFFLIAYRFLDGETKNKIEDDVNRFLKWDNIGAGTGRMKRFGICCRQQEFRNVLKFRLKSAPIISKLLGKIGFIFSPANKTVEIGGEIGGGMLVSHSFSVIFVKTAGKNLRVGPGVVIGRTGKGYPTIGNNVYIASNSTVIGDIVIGDNVIIGAGSVVTKDIPADSVAVGNPAKVIRSINQKDLEEIM